MADRPVHHETSYDVAHEHTPEELEKRAARGRARYYMIKKYGERVLKNKDIDHIHALASGGSETAPSNLRVRSIHANRGDKTY